MDEYTTQQSYLLTCAFHVKRRGAILVQVNPVEAQKEESLLPRDKLRFEIEPAQFLWRHLNV